MERGSKSEVISEGTESSLKPPKKLLSTQKWFAEVITQPLSRHHTLPPLAPSLRPIEEEAKEVIAPSLTLASHQRIELYYKQYWWRLLRVLHENFPMLTKLLGYNLFNQTVGIPYLVDYPPSDWALCKLGSSLQEWMEANYKGENKKLYTNAAVIDWAAQKAFWTKHHTSNLDPIKILDAPIQLQPHIMLLTFSQDLMTYRDQLLAEKDFQPDLKDGTYFFVIFRDLKNHVVWQPLQEAEIIILSSISQGKTIHQALKTLEEKGGKPFEEAQTLLPLFFQRWISLGWFFLPC